MAIAPITIGDTTSRAKINAAIEKANLVDDKADASALAIEAAQRATALNAEARLRERGDAASLAAIESEAARRFDAIRALPMAVAVEPRPGDALALYSASLAGGDPALIDPLSAGARFDEAGYVVRIQGDGLVAPRALYPLEPGRRYLVEFAVQRRVNSPDPDNDAIRLGLAWYGQGRGRLTSAPQSIVRDVLGLTTGSGRQTVQAVVSRSTGAEIDVSAPASARYVRPFVQTFGTLVQSDVEVIRWTDITHATAFAPDLGELEGRVAAQESVDAGDRLVALESQVTAPNSLRFATMGDAQAASIPVSADTLELLGYSEPGVGGARYRRVPNEPAHEGKFRSADGAWWELAEPVVTPQMVGGSVQAAFDAASAIGSDVDLGVGTYTFKRLAIPDKMHFRAAGAILRSDGSLTEADGPTILMGNDCRFDALQFETPGTERNLNIIEIGRRVKCDRIEAVSETQRPGGGIIVSADAPQLGSVTTRKIDRPLMLANESVVERLTGGRIGTLFAEDYVRAFRADFCSYTLGGIFARGRSPNASKSPGHNGVLIVGCSDFEMGDLFLADAGEHAFRIGGSPGAYTRTQNYKLGTITAVRPGGCAFKVNPTFEAAPGVTELAVNGTVTAVVGIDVGDKNIGGNSELLRLTHVRGLRIGSAYAYCGDNPTSAQYALQINDAVGVTIGELGGDLLNAGFINIDGSSDIDAGTYGGPVTDLRIGRLIGSMNGGTNGIGVNTTFAVSRVSVGVDGVRGYATNLIRWIAGNLTGLFEIRGRVDGPIAPGFQGAPVSDNYVVDLVYGTRRAAGRPGLSRISAAREIMPVAFNPASSAPTGDFLNGATTTAGAGNYGPAMEFSRLGSGRRGGAIAPRQGSADDKEVGLTFWVGDTNSTANEALLLAMVLEYTGRPSFPMLAGMATYADNTAALAAGLTSGMLYRTATGQIMQVF